MTKTPGRQLNARERALLRKAPMAMPADAIVGDNTQPVRTDVGGHVNGWVTLTDMVAEEPKVQAALRSLRLWHWQHALQASKRRDDWRTSPATKSLARQTWNFHMAAVQALNDLFPMGDTAERDAAAGTSMQPLLKTRIPT